MNNLKKLTKFKTKNDLLLTKNHILKENIFCNSINSNKNSIKEYKSNNRIITKYQKFIRPINKFQLKFSTKKIHSQNSNKNISIQISNSNLHKKLKFFSNNSTNKYSINNIKEINSYLKKTSPQTKKHLRTDIINNNSANLNLNSILNIHKSRDYNKSNIFNIKKPYLNNIIININNNNNTIINGYTNTECSDIEKIIKASKFNRKSKSKSKSKEKTKSKSKSKSKSRSKSKSKNKSKDNNKKCNNINIKKKSAKNLINSKNIKENLYFLRLYEYNNKIFYKKIKSKNKANSLSKISFSNLFNKDYLYYKTIQNKQKNKNEAHSFNKSKINSYSQIHILSNVKNSYSTLNKYCSKNYSNNIILLNNNTLNNRINKSNNSSNSSNYHINNINKNKFLKIPKKPIQLKKNPAIKNIKSFNTCSCLIKKRNNSNLGIVQKKFIQLKQLMHKKSDKTQKNFIDTRKKMTLKAEHVINTSTMMNNKNFNAEKQNKNSQNKNESNLNNDSHNVNKINYLGLKNKNLKKATRLRQLIFKKEKENDSIQKILFDNSNKDIKTIENNSLIIKNSKKLMINKSKKNNQIFKNGNKDNYLGRNRNIEEDYNKNNISTPELIDSSEKKFSFSIIDNIKYIEDLNNLKQTENNNNEKELYQTESQLFSPNINSDNNDNENDTGILSFNQVKDIILYNSFSNLNKGKNDFIFNLDDKQNFEKNRKNLYSDFFLFNSG